MDVRDKGARVSAIGRTKSECMRDLWCGGINNLWAAFKRRSFQHDVLPRWCLLRWAEAYLDLTL